MKRNIVLDANIEYNEMQRALYLAISYAARMPNVANPSAAEGFVFHYGDKNIFVKKLKQTEKTTESRFKRLFFSGGTTHQKQQNNATGGTGISEKGIKRNK